jgi:hypothetical protein
MGDNPAGNTVELSELPYAFAGAASSVQISNLTIEKYACVAQAGAIGGTGAGPSWPIEYNEIRYNHRRGITEPPGVHGMSIHLFPFRFYKLSGGSARRWMKNQIGLIALSLFHRFKTISGLIRHFPVGFCFENCSQPASYDLVIVSQKYPQRHPQPPFP